MKEFFDVPDPVELAIVARRDLQHSLLQWRAPRDNNQSITHPDIARRMPDAWKSRDSRVAPDVSESW